MSYKIFYESTGIWDYKTTIAFLLLHKNICLSIYLSISISTYLTLSSKSLDYGLDRSFLLDSETFQSWVTL